MKQKSKIRLDPKFIQRLLDKLKVGNRLSIHLNAVPGRLLSRLDLHDLSGINPDLPNEFIETLLSQTVFDFNLSFSNLSFEDQIPLAKTSKRLNHLVVEDREEFLELGQRNFAFGYPLLVKSDKGSRTKVIKAPLLIWDLEIARSDYEKNTWTISRREEAPIKVNELLIAHIAKDENIELPQLPDDVLEDGLVDQQELLKFCQQTLEALGSNFNHQSPPEIAKCLEAKEFDARYPTYPADGNLPQPRLYFSGIFGLYKSPKEAIIKATEQLLEKAREAEDHELDPASSRQSLVASIETNPSQEEIINTLEDEEIKLIQGPPGTGKSQGIVAIISNALANGRKILLVCEKKEALNVVYNKLEEIGLGEFAAVIDDVNHDRKKIVEKARNTHENHLGRGVRSFNQIGFDSDHQDFASTKKDYNQRHKNALEKILGHKSRKDLIASHLKSSRSSSDGQLNGQLDHINFQLDPEEFDQIDRQLKEAQRLYVRPTREAHEIFQPIDPQIFAGELTTQTHNQIRQAIDSGLELTKASQESLDQAIVDAQSELVLRLLAKFDTNQLDVGRQTISNLSAALVEIANSIKSFREQNPDTSYEKLFLKGPLPLIGKLSSKNRAIVKTRRQINAKIEEIDKTRANLKQMGLIVSAWPSLKKLESFESFEQQLNTSRLEAPKLDDVLSRTQQIAHNIRAQMQQMQNSETGPLLGIDNQSCRVDKTIDIDKPRTACDKVASHLNQYKDNFYQFSDYHAWRRHLSSCQMESVEILSKLMAANVPCQEWASCFEGYYNHQVLVNHENQTVSGFNTSSESLDRLDDLGNRLSKDQIDKIRHVWDSERDGPIHGQANFRSLYNLRGSRGQRRHSLRRIIKQDFDLFTSIFPVVLTNPSVANTLFPPKAGLFDFVIFDEASQLRIEDTFVNLVMGRQKIISGDEHQMPPSSYFAAEHVKIGDDEIEDDGDIDYTEDWVNSESLLKYAETLASGQSSKSYLDYHYRSRHPDLIAFSNAAVYGNNLISRPASKDYSPIDFANISGLYRSGSDPEVALRNTNQDEAQEILNILKDDIQANDDDGYPSVGIVTFNIPQRNLIDDLINRQMAKDPGFAAKLQAIREAGFFLRSVESVQGDERDIIIICTTFGPQGDGKFRQNLGAIIYAGSYRLLNVLITRAKQKIYVRTSIPTDYYRHAPDSDQKDGKELFYAYLYYSELISDGRRDDAYRLLEMLRENPRESPREGAQMNGLTESPFEEEVLQELEEVLPNETIRAQHKVAGFKLDFLIGTNLVLECDGKTYHQSEEAYKHDMYRQRELEGMGFVFYRIWSTNWFRDKESEIKRFLNFYRSHKPEQIASS